MAVPSPDAFLIDMADRALAIPQRAGIVLPRILRGLFFAALGSITVEAGVTLSHGYYDIAASLAAAVAALGWAFSAQMRAYRQDIAGWNAGVAARYRARALWHRERMWPARAPSLGFVLFLAWLLPRLDWSKWPLIVVTLGPLLVAMALMGVYQYGACAMPRDPDLRKRARGFAEAGA